MGYEGATLAPMFSQAPAKRAARRMVERGSEAWRRNVVRNTPIDDSPYPSRPPGTARRSWRVKEVYGPVPQRSMDTYIGGIETDDLIAKLLETGTGLYGPEHREYIIRPKNPAGWLRFYSRREGRWIYAKEVRHPGIHPQIPLQSGTVITEHELRTILQPTLVRWRIEQEAAARAWRFA